MVRRSGSLFSVRIAHLKRREWFNTGETQKAKAARQARDIFFFLRSNGWEATLGRFKPTGETPKLDVTIGEYLEAVRTHSTCNEVTLNIYASKLRTLVAEVSGIAKTSSIAYAKGEAYQKWISRVEGVKLSRLTPPLIQRWKKDRLSTALSPEKKAASRRTVNSILRNAKSLFGRRILEEVKGAGIALPHPLPFAEVQMERAQKIRYRSRVAPRGGIDWLMITARNELQPEIPSLDRANLRKSKAAIAEAKSRREQFKILILALGAGLRRSEIDTLMWEQLDFHSSTIRVETTEYADVKTERSEDSVDVHPSVMGILMGYRSQSTDVFVVESHMSSRIGPASYHHYRCYRHFRKLSAWLRSKGIDDQKPLHSLRKEFGSEILRQGGIFMASAQLRHSDIRTTRDAYSYKKQRVTVDLGQSLTRENLMIVNE